jgi:hypothetical protein
MRTILRSLFVVSFALCLFACSEDKACKEGTLFLSVDLSAVRAPIGSMTVSVLVEGGSPIVSDVAVASAATVQTVEITFPSGYPVGKQVSVNVVGRNLGSSIAFGASTLIAPVGCGTISVVLDTNEAVDAGIADSMGVVTPGMDDAAVAPPVACTVGAVDCLNRITRTCNSTGAWVETEECAAVCKLGKCTGDCAPGNTQCLGKGVQTCTEAAVWSAAVACPATCDKGVCQAACAVGAKQCKGNVVETCDANGTWVAGSACTNICRDGACTGDCKPTDTRCNGKVVQACSADAKWAAVQTCSYVCSANECMGECEPSKIRCNGGAIETCDATGAWKNTSTCEFSCVEGKCAPKMPGKPGVAPAVLSILPADGAKVYEKDTITVVFSEEMNTATVEAAYKALTPGSKTPTFKWSGDKTVVVITPAFTYPSGTVTTLAKGSYSFSLSTDAKDANGEALAAAVGRSYSLAYRRITTTIPFAQKDPNDALVSGNLLEKDPGTYSFMQVGFYASGGRNDAFATFFLDPLPAAIVKIEEAYLSSAIEVTAGPVTGFGNLRIAHAVFKTPLSSAAFDSSYTLIGESLPGTSLWLPGAKAQFTVTSKVNNDYGQRAALGNRSQFRFKFDGAPVVVSKAFLRLLRTSTNLRVVYLLD